MPKQRQWLHCGCSFWGYLTNFVRLLNQKPLLSTNNGRKLSALKSWGIHIPHILHTGMVKYLPLRLGIEIWHMGYGAWVWSRLAKCLQAHLVPKCSHIFQIDTSNSKRYRLITGSLWLPPYCPTIVSGQQIAALNIVSQKYYVRKFFMNVFQCFFEESLPNTFQFARRPG